MIIELSRQIFEEYQTQNFVKFRPVGVDLFHSNRQPDRRTDGRTDRQTDTHDEGNDRFSQFCERDKKALQETESKEVTDCHCISYCHLKPYSKVVIIQVCTTCCNVTPYRKLPTGCMCASFQIQERGNVSLSHLHIYIYINFIWLHVSTRNESSSGYFNLLL
jgi:hypothetical protein